MYKPEFESLCQLATSSRSLQKFSWWEGDCLFLRCTIQPNAKATEFVGTHDDKFKIRLAAEPIDGKANDELLKFLAKEFGVAKRGVSLVKGSQNKLKLVRIENPKVITRD